MKAKAELPDCPVATTVSLIGGKWKLLIIRNLSTRPWRFNELQRSLEGISQKVLTESLREMEADDLGDTESFKDCREFAVTGGVAGCVMNRFEKDGVTARILPINGLDKKTVRLMKTWEKRAPDADLVEVMACEGGCLAGPGTIVKPALAMKLRAAGAKPQPKPAAK